MRYDEMSVGFCVRRAMTARIQPDTEDLQFHIVGK